MASQSFLNRSGKPTGYGNGWTEQRVRGFRKHHDIAVYRDGEWAERGEITLDAAAQTIGVHKMTTLRMIQRGDLKGRQACKGAPWVIKAEDVAMFAARKRLPGPVTPSRSNPSDDLMAVLGSLHDKDVRQSEVRTPAYPKLKVARILSHRECSRSPAIILPLGNGLMAELWGA